MLCFSVPERTQLVGKAFYMEYRSNSTGKKVLHQDFAHVACTSSAISSSEPKRTAQSAWSDMACEGHTAPGELFIGGGITDGSWVCRLLNQSCTCCNSVDCCSHVLELTHSQISLRGKGFSGRLYFPDSLKDCEVCALGWVASADFWKDTK